MSQTAQLKRERLLALGRKRKATRLPGYACLADFHDGIFECDYVSPWTKSGHSIDADVMIIGQDWASADMLAKNPPRVAELGFDPTLQTNKNLDGLLSRHLGLRRADCYLTNLFVFIKLGGASATVRSADLVWSAQNFTIPEISIVSPTLVICLGLRTFRSLMRAAGLKPVRTTEQAVSSPFGLGGSQVHCVAHTGVFGTLNRSPLQVDRDWQALRDVLRSRTNSREETTLRASATFTLLKNPSEKDVSKLLAKAGSAGLRGIEDCNGNVFLWAFNDGTHMMVASVLDIPYDPATGYVDKLTGKTFYVRSLDDWQNRERRRSEPDSFTYQCRNGV